MEVNYLTILSGDQSIDGISDSMDKSLSKLQELAKDREAWHAAVCGGHRIGHDWVTELTDWSCGPTLLQPMDYARFLCPWDFQGKTTGVGCHFLLHSILDFLKCLATEFCYWKALYNLISFLLSVTSSFYLDDLRIVSFSLKTIVLVEYSQFSQVCSNTFWWVFSGQEVFLES